jgi:hypothetical protein
MNEHDVERCDRAHPVREREAGMARRRRNDVRDGPATGLGRLR